MLSKIIIIFLSLLLTAVSLSFFGRVEALEIQDVLIPSFSNISFTNPYLLLLLGLNFILMALGLLFSSIESSGKLTKLLAFLKNSEKEKDFNKLDKAAKEIIEYIKTITGDEVKTSEENFSVLNGENNEDNPKIEDINQNEELNNEGNFNMEEINPNEELNSKGNFNTEDINKKQSNENDFKIENLKQDEESSDGDSFKLEDIIQDKKEEKMPPAINLPNPNEFDSSEDKKTIISPPFDPKTMNELAKEDKKDDNLPHFSDFSEDEDSRSAETVIAEIPKELLKENPDDFIYNREDEFKKVFDKFYKMKVELGEPTKSLTEVAFLKKLKDTEETLIKNNNCKYVVFKVYNKEGKAALKATPKYW